MQSASSLNHTDEGNSLCNEIFSQAFSFFVFWWVTELAEGSKWSQRHNLLFCSFKRKWKGTCVRFSWKPLSRISSQLPPHPTQKQRCLTDVAAFKLRHSLLLKSEIDLWGFVLPHSVLHIGNTFTYFCLLCSTEILLFKEYCGFVDQQICIWISQMLSFSTLSPFLESLET